MAAPKKVFFRASVFEKLLIFTKMSLSEEGVGMKFAAEVNYKRSRGMFTIVAQTASDMFKLFNEAFVLI